MFGRRSFSSSLFSEGEERSDGITTATTTTTTTTTTAPPSPNHARGSFSVRRAHTIPTTLLQSSPASISPTSSQSSSAESPSVTVSDSQNRILSSFNPTQTYHIPAHGGLLVFPKTLSILSLTPFLAKRKCAADANADRKALKREARDLVQRRKNELIPAMYVQKGTNGGELELVDSGRSGDSDDGGGSGGSSGVVARWAVPWGLRKEVDITLLSPSSSGVSGNDEVATVLTGDFDLRSQEFDARGARYTWKFVSKRELVLEKVMVGAGKYVVAIFYLTVSTQKAPAISEWAGTVMKRAVGANEGTLVFDERGIDRFLCVASILVALKRERQRRAVLIATV